MKLLSGRLTRMSDQLSDAEIDAEADQGDILLQTREAQREVAQDLDALSAKLKVLAVGARMQQRVTALWLLLAGLRSVLRWFLPSPKTLPSNIAVTFYCLCGVLDGRSSYVLDFAATGDAKNSSSGLINTFCESRILLAGHQAPQAQITITLRY